MRLQFPQQKNSWPLNSAFSLPYLTLLIGIYPLMVRAKTRRILPLEAGRKEKKAAGAGPRKKDGFYVKFATATHQTNRTSYNPPVTEVCELQKKWQLRRGPTPRQRLMKPTACSMAGPDPRRFAPTLNAIRHR